MPRAGGRRGFPPWDGRRRCSAPCWPSALSPAWSWQSPWPRSIFPAAPIPPTPRELAKKAVAPGLLRSAVRLATEAQNRRLEARRLRRLRASQPSRVLPAILSPQKGRSLAIGFYVNWDTASGGASFDSLKRSLSRLDWVIPSWLYAERTQSGLQDQSRPALAQLYARPQAGRGDPAHAAECHHRQMGRTGPGQAAGRSGAPRKAGERYRQRSWPPTSCRASPSISRMCPSRRIPIWKIS